MVTNFPSNFMNGTDTVVAPTQGEGVGTPRVSNPTKDSFFDPPLTHIDRREMMLVIHQNMHTHEYDLVEEEVTAVVGYANRSWTVYAYIDIMAEYGDKNCANFLAQTKIKVKKEYNDYKNSVSAAVFLARLRRLIESPEAGRLFSRKELMTQDLSVLVHLFKQVRYVRVIPRSAYTSPVDVWNTLTTNLRARLLCVAARRLWYHAVSCSQPMSPQMVGEGWVATLMTIEKDGLVQAPEKYDVETTFSRKTVDQFLSRVTQMATDLQEGFEDQGWFADIGEIITNVKSATAKMDKESVPEMNAALKNANVKMEEMEKKLESVAHAWTPRGMAENVVSVGKDIFSKLWEALKWLWDLVRRLGDVLVPLAIHQTLCLIAPYVPKGTAVMVINIMMMAMGWVIGFNTMTHICDFVPKAYDYFKHLANDASELFCPDLMDEDEEEVPLFRDKGKAKTGPADENVDQQLDYEAVLTPLALAYIAMGVDVTRKDDVVKNIKNFPGFAAGANAICAALMKFAVDISQWMTDITGVDVSLAKRLDHEYAAWIKRARPRLIDEKFMSSDCSLLGIASLEVLIDDGKVLLLKYSKTNQKVFIGLMTHQIMALEKLLLEIMTSAKRYRGTRVMPVGLLLQGAPGCGKTQLAMKYAHVWCLHRFRDNPDKKRRFLDNPAQFIYTRTTETFMNGITPETEVIIHDDISTTMPSTAEDSKWVDLVQELNEIPVAVKHSESDKKGNIIYNQSLSIVTCNPEFINDKFVTEKPAVQRRLHHKFRVSNKGEFVAADSGLAEFSLDIYNLELLRVKPLATDHWEPTGVMTDPTSLFAAMLGTYEKHKDFFDRNNKNNDEFNERFLNKVDALRAPKIPEPPPGDDGVDDEDLKAAFDTYAEEFGDGEEDDTSPGFFREGPTLVDVFGDDESNDDQMQAFVNKQFDMMPPSIDTALGPPKVYVKIEESDSCDAHDFSADFFGQTIMGAYTVEKTIDVSEPPMRDAMRANFAPGLDYSFKMDRDGFMFGFESGSDFNSVMSYNGDAITAEYRFSQAMKIGVIVLRWYEQSWLEKNVPKMFHVPIILPNIGMRSSVSGYSRRVKWLAECATEARTACLSGSFSTTRIPYRVARLLFKIVGFDFAGANPFADEEPKSDVSEDSVLRICLHHFRALGIHASSLISGWAQTAWQVLVAAAKMIYDVKADRFALARIIKHIRETSSTIVTLTVDYLHYGAMTAYEYFVFHAYNPAKKALKAGLQWFKQNYALVLTGFGSLAALWGLIQTFRPKTFFDQESGAFKLPPKRARDFKKARVKQKFARQAGRDAKDARHEDQGVALRVYEEIVPVLRRNVWQLKIGDEHKGFFLALRARVFLWPRHYWASIVHHSKNGVLELEFINEFVGSYKMMSNQVATVHDFGSGKDLHIFTTVGVNLPESKSILQHFATPEEASFIFSERSAHVGVLGQKSWSIVEGYPKKADPDNVYQVEPIATSDFSVPSRYQDGARFDMITYELPTRVGACGTLVITGDKVVGVHVNGNGRYGHAARVDIAMIKNALSEEYQQRTGKEADPSFFSELEYEWEEFDSLEQGYDMSVHSGVPVGILKKPTSVFVKQDLVRYNGFSADLPDSGKLPVDVRPHAYGPAREPYKEYPTDIDMDVLRDAARYAGSAMARIKWGGSFEPYGLRVAIEGIPGTGFGPMDLKTSAGFPENTEGLSTSVFFWKDGEKTMYGPRFPALVKKIRMCWSLMQHGIMPVFVFTDMLKYELRAFLKHARLISGSCKEHHLLTRMAWGPMMRWATETQEHNAFLVGSNPAIDWDAMEREFLRFGGNDRHGAGDYSGWDVHTEMASTNAATEAFEIMAGDWGAYGHERGQCAARIRACLARSSVESYHARGRVIERWNCGWASGSGLTALHNSARNYVKLIYAFGKTAMLADASHSLEVAKQAMSIFHDVVYVKVMGDDNRFAVRIGFEWFNLNSIASAVADFGDVYTDDAKGEVVRDLVPISDVSILKRRGVYHSDLGIYTGALDLEIIFQMLRWTIRGREVEVTRQRADGAVRELAMHPVEVWNRWYPIIRDFVGPMWTPTHCDYSVARDEAIGWKWSVAALEDNYEMGSPPFDQMSPIMNSTPNNESPMFEAGGDVVRTTAISSSNVTTKFADDTIGSRAEGPAEVDLPLEYVSNVTTPAAQSIIDYLERPSVFQSGTLTTTDSGILWFTQVHTAISALKLAKIQGIFTIRADVEFTFQANADMFQSGRYILGWLPDGGFHVSAWRQMHTAHLTTITQLPHVEIDLAKQTHVSLSVPFTLANTHAVIGTTGVSSFGGAVFLIPYSPLVAGLGGTSAGYTVWARFTNIKLGSPTVNQMVDIETQEAQLAKVQKPSAVLARVSAATSVLGELPLIGSYASSVSWVASVLSRSAEAMGWSKPLTLNAPQRFDRKIIPYNANFNQPSLSKPLGMSSENRVIQSTGASRTEVDEMAFDFIKTKYAYLATFNWVDSQASGTVLLSQNITDTYTVNYGKGIIPLPVTFVSQFFTRWTGGIKYRFKMVKTPFHRGRLLIAFAPGTSNNNFTIDQSEYLYREVVDISTTSEFEVCIPYLLPTPWQTRGQMIGTMRIFVLDKLALPTSVSPIIPIITEVAGDDDFKVAIEAQFDYEPYAPSVSQMADPYVVTPCFDLGPTRSPETARKEAATIGEVIQSFRQVVKIPHGLRPTGTAWNIPNQGTAFYLPYLVVPVTQAVTLAGVLYRGVFFSDLLNLLQCCYAFSTGGIRCLLVPEATPSSTIGSRVFVSTASASTNAGWYATDPANHMQRCFSVINIEGPVDVQIPTWNSRYARMTTAQLVNPTSITTAEPNANCTTLNVSFTDPAEVTTNFGIWRSAADDFHCSRWVSTVPQVAFATA